VTVAVVAGSFVAVSYNLPNIVQMPAVFVELTLPLVAGIIRVRVRLMGGNWL